MGTLLVYSRSPYVHMATGRGEGIAKEKINNQKPNNVKHTYGGQPTRCCGQGVSSGEGRKGDKEEAQKPPVTPPRRTKKTINTNSYKKQKEAKNKYLAHSKRQKTGTSHRVRDRQPCLETPPLAPAGWRGQLAPPLPGPGRRRSRSTTSCPLRNLLRCPAWRAAPCPACGPLSSGSHGKQKQTMCGFGAGGKGGRKKKKKKNQWTGVEYSGG